MKKWVVIVFTLVLLGSAVLLIYLLFRGINYWNKSKVVGLPVKSPPGHYIHPYRLLTHDSTEFKFEPGIAKGILVGFFFTRCPHVCPVLTANMKRVSERLKSIGLDTGILIVFISVDPEYDRPHVLRKYREFHGIYDDNWVFVTGSPDTIELLSKEDFFAPLQFSARPEEALHTTLFYLLDDSLRIRGIYRGMDSTHVDSIVRDVRMLLGAFSQ